MTIIKIKKIKVQNLRNVRHGEIMLAVNFETFLKPNVVGLYGQNGSGKTTIVDAFGLLKALISGWMAEIKLPSQEKKLIMAGEDTASIEFEFLVENQFGAYFLNYYVELQEDENRLYTTVERVAYRENEKGKRSKILMNVTEEDIQLRKANLSDMNEKMRIQLLVIHQLSKNNICPLSFTKI